MTLQSDTKFGEKLALGSKNNMSSLVNFKGSSGEPEHFHFDMLLLLIYIKFQLC